MQEMPHLLPIIEYYSYKGKSGGVRRGKHEGAYSSW